MLPFELQTPRDIARTLAGRAKELRLEREWTQQEIAERAGLALATYQRFERTGRISLERLLKLAVVLDARGGFEHLFVAAPARSLAELEQRLERPSRRRGKRSDAQT
jgi:transcriptional regulator with XRE-family HTH domain